MSQVITRNDELLDGGQIENKLHGALKSGQSPFGLDDKRCYDKGQIATKYNAVFNGDYALSADNRLPAHEGYRSAISFKYGSSPYNAYNADFSTFLFVDYAFDGTAFAQVRNGTSLYNTNNNSVGVGYFMFYTGSAWAYWTTNTYGTVDGNYQIYVPSYIEETWGPYCYQTSDVNADLASIVSYLDTNNGWTANLGSIYKNSSTGEWHVSFNQAMGTWGAKANGTYVQNWDLEGDWLTYRFKRISNGVIIEEGERYKNTTRNISPASFSVSASQNNITVNITSSVKWSVQVASGAFITGGGTGEGTGSVTFTVASNSGGARSGTITVSDPIGQLSSVNITVSQAAYSVPLSEVPYYGFVDYNYLTFDLTEDKNNCYYSGQTGSIYYNSTNYTYYQDSAGNYTALPGMYMITQGMDGYPGFSDSEFITLNY